MKTTLQSSLLILLNIIAGSVLGQSRTIYKTPTLEIDSIAQQTYVHRTFLETKEWGKVSCNGAVYVNNNEAIVFDTPPTDSVSLELISWIEKHDRAHIKAIVVNHAHEDCLGGLAAFHKAGIASYSSRLTQEQARKDTVNKPTVPQQGFDKVLELSIGNSTIVNYYPGEGHTHDNIVSYIPAVRTLFGGCIVKALDAGKGNLAEANVNAWSESVRRVKQKFSDAVIIIPGHGAYGNRSLLDYTINIFKK